MTNERYQQLMKDNSLPLTEEEMSQGWHFCPEWDFLLINPEMGEFECCNCVRENSYHN